MTPRAASSGLVTPCHGRPDEPSCTICGGADLHLLHRVARHRLLRCRSCRLVFVPVEPGSLDVATLYGPSYYGEHGEAPAFYPGYRDDRDVLERNFDDLLGWVETLVRPGRLVEVGSAFGYFLGVARRRGWDVMGVEASAFSSRVARDEVGVPVHEGTLQTLPPNAPFDAAFMLDTIEHLEDPRAELCRLSQRLAPAGHLVVTTGDIGSVPARLLGRRWRMIVPPHHLFYFDERTLRRLLEACGFEVVACRRLGRRYSLRSLVRHLTRGRIRSAPGWSVPVNLGDVMTVLARRRTAVRGASRPGSTERGA